MRQPMPIIMEELEEIMSQKTGLFDVNTEDTFEFGINLLCSGVHFNRTKDKSKYFCMILKCQSGEVVIESDIINLILFDEEEKTIMITFTLKLPNLIIKYRE